MVKGEAGKGKRKYETSSCNSFLSVSNNTGNVRIT